jgi:UDP-sulfoquinovose synthase
LSESLLDSLVNIAVKYRDRVDETQFLPRVDWRRPRNDRRRTSAPSADSVEVDTKS